MSISVIKKRDGRIMPFDMKKISDAIDKSFRADGEDPDIRQRADALAWEVTTLLELEGNPAPTVEHVQDLVEQVLMNKGYLQTAKRYILYRQARTDARNRRAQTGGSVVLDHWEPTLAGQAMAICAAVRNNGGADRLLGYYESLAPAAENALQERYTDCLRLILELRTEKKIPFETLRQIRRRLADEDLRLLGQGKEEYLRRQADLICAECGADLTVVENSQKQALEEAVGQTKREIARTLRQLRSRGCTPELIAPPEAHTPAVDLVLASEE